MDPYERLAEDYDLFFGPFDQHNPHEVSFFDRLFVHHNVKRVLDCACRTGRNLHLFHSLGCQVLGSDTSPSLLAQAERNLASHHLNVQLEQLDYRELPMNLATQYDAVVCLSSAIFDMPNETELIRAFVSMNIVLRDQGLLVLCTGISDRTWHEHPQFIPEMNCGNFTRSVTIDYFERSAQCYIVDVYHDGRRTDSPRRSFTYPHVYLHDDLMFALRSAGFTSIQTYGGFEFKSYDSETSDMLIAVAVK